MYEEIKRLSHYSEKCMYTKFVEGSLELAQMSIKQSIPSCVYDLFEEAVSKAAQCKCRMFL